MSLQNNNHSQSPLHSSNKSKKSKNDMFRVGLLLKQKKFVANEKFRKSDIVLQQNKNQFAMQKMIDSDLYSSNSFAYSNVQCITNNHQLVDHQFARFIQFVESQPESLQFELKRFFAPMLCHLYLELLKAREPKAATDFLKKYAHLVAAVDLYDAPLPTKINGCSVSNDVAHANDASAVPVTINANIRFARTNGTDDAEIDYFMKLVQILSVCTKLETAESDVLVSHFRSSKYELHTTKAVVDVLNAFMEKRGHVLLLNLLYTWIQVHIVDNEVRQFTEDYMFLNAEDEDEVEDFTDESANREQKPKASDSSKSVATKRAADDPIVKLETSAAQNINVDDDKSTLVQQNNVEVCLQTLRECRAQLSKPQIETPRFLKIADKSRGLTSAHIDADECHLVAGFDNSAVQLWQLNQHQCRGKNFFRQFPVAQCRWEINNCESEEDDEVELNENIKRKYRSYSFAAEERPRYRKFEDSRCTNNSYNEFGGVRLYGHGLGVTDVLFSAHYPLIYSVSKDATMRSWRAHNYSCAGIYRGHRYPIWCLDESPTGMFTATGSKDLSARLWCLEREYPLIIYAGHTQDVECIAFHPNGSYIATGSSDHSVRLWCVTSGKLMRVFSDCKQAVTTLAFSPDGKMLATGGEETKVRIFDLAAGTQLSELKDHSANVTNLSWNPNAQQLASVCSDGSFRLWDVKKLTLLHENSSSSTTSSSSTNINRSIALNSSCQRLIQVLYSKRTNTLYSIGS